LVEKHLDQMVEKYFKKNKEWATRKEDLEHWKMAMRKVSRKYMDETLQREDFSKKFYYFLTHHNLRRAIHYGKKLSK
tara:strand:- start:13457 stop:13687 length:231 start_codon:yes stop_codon:yes gene_type:complete